jgi:hypothetical protein
MGEMEYKEYNEMRKHRDESLLKVLTDYAVPDPKIVGKLPKGGASLDFVGHADITKILIEVCPTWTWEPVEYDEAGLPKYTVVNGMAHMAGWLQIHGVRRLAIGSVQDKKPDIYKELISDSLRNGAMRFGIALKLWSKQEWEDLDHHKEATPAKKAGRPAKQQTATEPEQAFLNETSRQSFERVCAEHGLDHVKVAANARIDWAQPVPISALPALRDALKDLSSFKEGTNEPEQG